VSRCLSLCVLIAWMSAPPSDAAALFCGASRCARGRVDAARVILSGCREGFMEGKGAGCVEGERHRARAGGGVVGYRSVAAARITGGLAGWTQMRWRRRQQQIDGLAPSRAVSRAEMSQVVPPRVASFSTASNPISGTLSRRPHAFTPTRRQRRRRWQGSYTCRVPMRRARAPWHCTLAGASAARVS
jgi:hypothetical protein